MRSDRDEISGERVAGNKNGGHQAKVNSSAPLFTRSTAESHKKENPKKERY